MAVSKPDIFDINTWISETGHFRLNMVLETDILWNKTTLKYVFSDTF